jgi:hypothetical protein
MEEMKERFAREKEQAEEMLQKRAEVCMCMSVCVFVCVLYVCVHKYFASALCVCTHILHKRAEVCMHVFMHVRMYCVLISPRFFF